MRKLAPHLEVVPKDYLANLLFRQEVLSSAAGSVSAADDIWEMCRQDGLFFLNVFGWTRDGRGVETPIRPIITYPYQDQVLLEIWDAAGLFGGRRRDVLIKKSRDMVLTWTCIAADIWPFVFHGMMSLLWISRKEEYVWKKGDPKALFTRGQFILDMLPPFLQPAYEIAKLHLENKDGGGVIDGESTTENAAAGDKRGKILLDEFALSENGFAMLSATSQASDCRVFNSTPRGTGTAFYALEHEAGRSAVSLVKLHWPLHPEHGAGLYTHVGGELVILDEGYEYEEGFEFVHDLDYHARSPWYDIQCQRAGSKREIAQELDMSDFGAGDAFFAPEDLLSAQQYVRPPLLRGRVDILDGVYEVGGFHEEASGHLALWAPLVVGERPPEGTYVVGCDISAGTGASDSTACIYNSATHEKAGEYVDNRISPHNFAELVVSLCRWFYDAHLIWEGGGPGRQFAERVLELGYRDIYYQRTGKTRNEVPGFFPTNQTKQTTLAYYRRVWARGDLLNRSQESIAQAQRYEFGPNNTVVYSGTRSSDPSGQGDNHGDIVIGDALACKAMFASQARADTRPSISKDCLYWHMQEAAMAEAEAEDDW